MTALKKNSEVRLHAEVMLCEKVQQVNKIAGFECYDGKIMYGIVVNAKIDAMDVFTVINLIMFKMNRERRCQ